MSVFFSLALAGATAWAHGNATGTPPITLPPAPAGDGAEAQRILKQVQSRTKATPLASVVERPIESAKRALQRAHGARAAGDVEHAHLLDQLALKWAEMARDLERAAAVEQAATAAAKQAKEAAVQVERARALLEETQARRGRAEAELERVRAEAREAKETAALAEQARLQAGKKGPSGAPSQKKQPKKEAPK